MDEQIFIVEYDLFLVNIKTKDVFPKHMIEKRTTLKSFEDLLTKICNDINVNQDSIRKYKAEEIV